MDRDVLAETGGSAPDGTIMWSARGNPQADLTQGYAINAGLHAAGCVALGPGEEAWASNGQFILATLPDKLWLPDGAGTGHGRTAVEQVISRAT